MSFSAHRFLRPRSGAGLPSVALHSRLRPGYWCRPRGIFQQARWHLHDARRTNAQPPTEPELLFCESEPLTSSSILANHSLNRSQRTQLSPSSSARSAFQEDENDLNDESDFLDESELIDETPLKPPKPLKLIDPCDPNRSYRSLRVGNYVEGNRQLRHNALVVNNGTVSYRERIVDEEAYLADQEIRSSSWFIGRRRLRMWKSARNELFKAKYYKRPVSQEDLVQEFELREADNELLTLLQSPNLDGFRESWNQLDVATKSEHWMRLSLWLIANEPTRALKFLYITCQDKQRPLLVMISECLLFLRNYPKLFDSWRWESVTFPDLVATCLDPHYWPIVYTPQKGIRFFIGAANDDDVLRAWKLVYERQVHTSAETYLAWASRFTRMRNIDLALEALEHVRQIGQVGLEITSEPVKRHGCLLLLLDSVKDGPEGRNFRILPRLLEMGMRPDLEMMDLILANCYKTGDPELGRDMLNHMQSQGYPLTTYTYVTLLSDATRRLDRSEINRLKHEIEMQGEDIRTNRFVKSKLFHAYFCLNVKDQTGRPEEMDNKHAFRSLFRLYNEMYDISPLKKLGIVPQSYRQQVTGRSPLRTEPDAVPLFLMIASYLRCHSDISVTARVYDRFVELLENEDPVISPLGRTDHTWHEFMFAWRNDVRGLRPSVRLVGTMERFNTEDQGVSPDQPNFRPKPTVYIWTALVSAFLWNKEPNAAEKVLELMDKYKVKYNKVLWTSLIYGYAQNKDILKVAQTIRAMESAGHEMDAFTIRALRHIQDPERLWQAVDELDKQANEQVHSETYSSLTDKLRLDDLQGDGDWLLDQGLQRMKAKAQARAD
ncbi:pentatricopeptide repeat protein [Aspergillus saccharolyticus JOP 1030-1]|uniref:Pentatricopeptide repeat protein n=1 Tax=Aspergillus saccharolyticus JOP 1030-1 TaxID=1450539 RepID=A0A318ZA12_9EURO|nr:hypothetical protein BP01DRAFT_360362 [Aspergillus saccharolyticus JOP 1030-1]PYH41543.1 hypothetical protein BP01DRAFT_360362 [Aspergillus saccharolyticus JOP 1030-1]